MYQFPRKNKGFSLIELLLAIGIGMVIVGAVWWKFKDFMDGFKAEQYSESVRFIISNADNMYAHNIEFATVDNAGNKSAINMGALMSNITDDIPANIIKSGSVYTNEWNGNWIVGNASTNGGSTLDLLTVQMSNVPPNICRTMTIYLAPEMFDTRINGSLVPLEKNDTSTPVWRSTVNLTKGLPLCNVANNTLVFRKLKELDLSTLRRVKPFYNPLTDQEKGLNISQRRYRVDFLSQYNRLQNAYQSRETAQSALD